MRYERICTILLILVSVVGCRSGDHEVGYVLRGEPPVTLRQLVDLRDQMGTTLEANLQSLSVDLKEASLSPERRSDLQARCRQSLDLLHAYMDLCRNIEKLERAENEGRQHEVPSPGR